MPENWIPVQINPFAPIQAALQDAARDIQVLANGQGDYRVVHALQSLYDAVEGVARLCVQAQLDARMAAQASRPLTPGAPGYACGICGSLFTPAGEPRDEHSRHADTPWCRGCVNQCREGSEGHRCVICTTEGETP